MWFTCRHQFSWPRHSGNGEYYQICLQCGVKYRYDWSAMRRTGRWEHEVKAQEMEASRSPGHKRSSIFTRRPRTELAPGQGAGSVWRLRERRLRFETPVLYRQKETHEWLHGLSENISRTGLLFQVTEALAAGTQLELILEMPAEITGAAGAKVICQATVTRVARQDKNRPRLGVAIGDYQFLPQGQVAGL
jgi:hypothetical protein